jgi:hypothetical protein
MGIVDDILRALDRIPIWKRLQELPSEVDDLKARVAAFEDKLSGKWPPDVCRYCGARAARLVHSHLIVKALSPKLGNARSATPRFSSLQGRGKVLILSRPDP